MGNSSARRGWRSESGWRCSISDELDARCLLQAGEDGFLVEDLNACTGPAFSIWRLTKPRIFHMKTYKSHEISIWRLTKPPKFPFEDLQKPRNFHWKTYKSHEIFLWRVTKATKFSFEDLQKLRNFPLNTYKSHEIFIWRLRKATKFSFEDLQRNLGHESEPSTSYWIKHCFLESPSNETFWKATRGSQPTLKMQSVERGN